MTPNKRFWAIAGCFGMAGIFPLMVTTGPDFSFPLLPELLTLSTLFMALTLLVREKRLAQVLLSRSETAMAMILGTMCFLWLGRAALEIFQSPGECFTHPGRLYGFTCWLQNSIQGQVEGRYLYMHLTAWTCGGFAFILGRVYQSFFKKLLLLFLLPTFVVLLSGFWGLITKHEQLLPPLFGLNVFGFSRFTFLFTNPSWVWPYLAPACCILMWVFLYPNQSRVKRSLSVVVLLLAWSGVLLTQQRGAWLLLGVHFLVGIFFTVKQLIAVRLKNSRNINIISLGLVCGGAFLLYMGKNQIIGWTLDRFGVSIQKTMNFEDQPRLLIFRQGLKLFLDSPLFGHGIGSWYPVNQNYSGPDKVPYIFDTAHNWWVQTFFELGVLHALALILTVLLVVRFIRKNLGDIPNGMLLFWLGIVSFAITSLVQEIDFIRPTYYNFALFCGLLLSPQKKATQKEYDFVPSYFFEVGKSILALTWLKKACAIVTFLLLILFCVVAINLSYGISPFQPFQDHPKLKFSRWIFPQAWIAKIKGPNHTYGMYPFLSDPPGYSVNQQFSLFSLAPASSWDVKAPAAGKPERNYLVSPVRKSLFHSHMEILFSSRVLDHTRFISAAVGTPPYISTLGIWKSKGMYDWEVFPENQKGFWCQSECEMIFNSCGTESEYSLDIAHFAPSLVNPPPVLNLSYFSTTVSSGQWDQPQHTGVKNQISVTAGNRTSIRWNSEHSKSPQASHVFIKADFQFNLLKSSLGADARDLSFVILEPTCHQKGG